MLHVGTVPYLVARPLDAGLEEEPGISLRKAVPAELIRGLREGAIDVALVSAIELFRRPGYRYLDGYSVGGRGHVASVQVFLRRALAEVQSVAMDPASRAAAALTRIVWPGERPEFRELEPGADPRAAEADAWLRIGDPALVETFEPEAHAAFNPSERWHAETRLVFPFAVWVVRPNVELDALKDAFERARERGLARRQALADEVQRRLGVPADAARRYFHEEIEYRPGTELGRALAELRRRAAPLDLIDPACVPTPIAPLEEEPDA